jgi:four helix bundle protein
LDKLPKNTVAQVLGKQVLRSGTSVGANYREAHRGRSKAEFIAKVGDSLRELEETADWLELLVEGKSSPRPSWSRFARKPTSSPQSSSRFSSGRKNHDSTS